MNSYLANGKVPQRHGTGGNVIVPYQTFDTADGKSLCLAPGNDRLWVRCAVVLGHPDWATDPKYARSAARVANKAELLPLIAASMKRQTRAHWIEAMDKAGVPCSPVNESRSWPRPSSSPPPISSTSSPNALERAVRPGSSACRSPSTASGHARRVRRPSSASIRTKYCARLSLRQSALYAMPICGSGSIWSVGRLAIMSSSSLRTARSAESSNRLSISCGSLARS